MLKKNRTILEKKQKVTRAIYLDIYCALTKKYIVLKERNEKYLTSPIKKIINISFTH